ncbi:MAG: FAD-dependent monooxygenase [Xanthobacteraceae bacterium]|jgi:2-polyprenyl-6-methoxyphenol hydroxylase-like FAD-dependent oxidoreductase
MPSKDNTKLPIIIVGGGIGGVATALALSRKGYAVQILEQAPELKEIGAGIQMPPNAFKAFKILGVLEDVQKNAAYPEKLVLGDMLTGKAVYQSPIDDEFVARFGYRYALLHRGDILEALLNGCRSSPLVTLTTNSKVVKFKEADDRVVVTTADGSTYEGRAMVAADGLWSESRATLFGSAAPTTDSYVLCRGVVPVKEIPQELYSQSVTMWGGPELDFFHYPLRRDQIFNIGASYRDPSVKFEDGYPRGNRDMMMERFRDACPHVKALLEHIDVSRAWVLYDRPPLKEWSKGRVTLLGDAAHPTYVYISQGACMALEDAIVLADMVDRHAAIEDAFLAYQKERYLRTARIQLTSRQFGEIYHAVGVQRELRNQLLANADPRGLHETLAWVFGDILPN